MDMLSARCPDGRASWILSEAQEQGRGQRADLDSSESWAGRLWGTGQRDRASLI